MLRKAWDRQVGRASSLLHSRKGSRRDLALLFFGESDQDLFGIFGKSFQESWTSLTDNARMGAEQNSQGSQISEDVEVAQFNHIISARQDQLTLRWDDAWQAAQTDVEGLGPDDRPSRSGCPPWLVSGDHNLPFDFCGHVGRLLVDITQRCPEMNHVNASRILVAVTQARNGRKHGLQSGSLPCASKMASWCAERNNVTYQVQRFFLGDHELLYLMTFCLPRFLNQEFDDKFITLFHELSHIGPHCDGDLRRHDGRYCLHSHSQKHYDKVMAHLARAYVAAKPNPDLFAFLRLNFGQLCQRHGGIDGVVVPRPKVFPISWPGVEFSAARE